MEFRRLAAPDREWQNAYSHFHSKTGASRIVRQPHQESPRAEEALHLPPESKLSSRWPSGRGGGGGGGVGGGGGGE
ncbi:hypothetical protein GWI33_006806 [Rhynchophorus ferrugineus]|uniref:Uncharacterized protein n=1 Tax=Rhynchophorus ferrugineus TaxID=354439 RepID=A0A834II99_RHYFE|nr:hypothetical protein GWI33_006806 [Rhynchophorus ferrugineus]